MASDCANATSGIHGKAFESYGHIILEIKAAAKTFQEVQFVHERRESNFEAHSVATSALFNSVGQHVWFFGLADGICNFVLTDQ